MSPQTQKLLEEVLRLPLEERELIATQLYDSLADDSEDEAAWSAEIQRRVEELKAGMAETVRWTEVRQRMVDFASA